jgi:hypothetical protein
MRAQHLSAEVAEVLEMDERLGKTAIRLIKKTVLGSKDAELRQDARGAARLAPSGQIDANRGAV